MEEEGEEEEEEEKAQGVAGRLRAGLAVRVTGPGRIIQPRG